MTHPTLVRDLFDIQDSAHQGAFVVKLTEGLQRPEQTAAEYVVTPGLVDAFDQSLGLIGRALHTGKSMATYLHGSFGSGKSHFMAILSLLLQGHEAAWRIAELHGLREKHAFAGKEKLLELHFHMIGARSLEEKLFSTYVDYVESQHPDEPLPGLFADEELFENARQMIARVGADTFFADMGDAGKKTLRKRETGWTQERFDQAASSSDPKEREKLFSALVKSWFGSYTSQGKYIDLDTGLQVLANHAQSLGYQGVVLFLDELILWLVHRASERSWLNTETEKMIKLVEAQSLRAIPIVSFIARQRALQEMVGKMYTGQDERLLNDLLDLARGRIDTIKLEDNNLPAIVEKRVLVLKPDKRETLQSAFESMRRSAGKSWETLLASDDPDAFRKLYPFSPVLVDALVSLSNSLQRQRTAIKLLVELLTEHISDLKLGEVVCVGDLYDVLAGGEEPTDGVMLSLFRSAKQLYEYQFLPVLQESNGTTTPEKCQRLRQGHPKRLGCSGCPELQCRADNRLVKTLLVAALGPKVLSNMTVSRLSQLNHGTLKVAVPGMEVSLVAQKLRKWGAQNLPLHVGPEKDPAVSVRLEGVDIKPILAKYAGEDSSGNRQRVLRELLFDALGIDKVTDTGKDETVTFHQTKRKGRIVFGNVRALGVENLRCPDDHDYRLVIDYPFDEPGKTPNDDIRALEGFMDQQSSWTLVWLPHFFSEASNRILGDLTILEHIFSSSEVKRQAVAHLSKEDQSRAINDLDNQRNQKRLRLQEVLEKAYGLRRQTGQGFDEDLDVDLRTPEHLMLLTRGADPIQPELAPNLASAVHCFVTALLSAKFPNHPAFTHALSAQRLENMVDRFGQLISYDDKRMPAERDLAAEMNGVLGVLGLVRRTEGYVHVEEAQTLQDLEKARTAEGLARPTVAEVRRWIDPKGLMGLPIDVQDVVVRCYALHAKRTIDLNGKPFQPLAKKEIPGHATLERPDMPEQTEWAAAITKAGHCLGVPVPGNYLSPDNLMKLHGAINAELQKVAKECSALPSLLAQRGEVFGLGGDTDRITTARCADRLCVELLGKSAADQIRALGAFTPETSAQAVGRNVVSSKGVRELLSNALVFGVFSQLVQRSSDLAGAAELVEEATKALRQDEIHVDLVARLRQLAERGQELLSPAAAALPATGQTVATGKLSAKGAEQIQNALREASEQIQIALGDGDEGVELTLQFTLTRKG